MEHIRKCVVSHKRWKNKRIYFANDDDKETEKKNTIAKAAESFTNKAEKWSNTDRQQDLDPVSNRMKASKRVWIDWVNKKIFNPQNYEDANWHTGLKCPQRGLHLVIHNFKWNNGKKGYEKGFTFIEDERFYCPESEAFYPLRLELIPRKDKNRQTIGYTVYKNEFGLQEDYEVFYNRHKSKLKTYSTTEQILEVSKSGIWREHPLRNYTKDGIQYPGLRYDLNKHGWKKVTESRSFCKYWPHHKSRKKMDEWLQGEEYTFQFKWKRYMWNIIATASILEIKILKNKPGKGKWKSRYECRCI